VAYTSNTARVTFEVFVLSGIFCSPLDRVNEKPSGAELRPSSYLRRVSNGVSQIANSLDQLHLPVLVYANEDLTMESQSLQVEYVGELF
jgi:hypothetical protein